MARYCESVCRLCRRENLKMYLKGDRCYTDKCAIERRPYPPGQHGQGRVKFSEYGVQLREKQKVKRMYGLLEAGFRHAYANAAASKGKTGENLLQALELRLDNVVFRMGFADTRNEARQLVRHGHFKVNGRKVNIASYVCRVGDVVELKERSKKVARIVEALEAVDRRGVPAWLELDKAGPEGHGEDLAGARGHHHAHPGAADRRAVLEVAAAVPTRRGPGRRRVRAVNGRASHGAPIRQAGRSRGGGGGTRRQPMASDAITTKNWRDLIKPRGLTIDQESPLQHLRQVRGRAAGARLRHHARQHAAPGAALQPAGRRHHLGQDRGGGARVHDHPRGRRGRHRHHPQPQGSPAPDPHQRGEDHPDRGRRPRRRSRPATSSPTARSRCSTPATTSSPSARAAGSGWR